jgi:hypothetical protein
MEIEHKSTYKVGMKCYLFISKNYKHVDCENLCGYALHFLRRRNLYLRNELSPTITTSTTTIARLATTDLLLLLI